MNANTAYNPVPSLSAADSAAGTFPETDVIYEIARPEHRTGVLEVLTLAFVNEPSTAAQTIPRPTYKEWRRFTAFYLEECLNNGLSTVAVDRRDGKTVLGAIITRDFLTPPDPRCIEFVESTAAFAPIVQVLDIIDAAWFEKHPDLLPGQRGRVADLWMGGVRAECRHRGIASTLGQISLDRVASTGFEYAIAECTGAFSQHLVKTAGFETVFELAYTDLVWNGEAIFRNVPAPHTHWGIYEKGLSHEPTN